MEVKAQARYVRMSPYKIRRVADLIRGKNVEEAMRILELTKGKAPLILKKLLQSAVFNARQRGDIDIETLRIKTLMVDGGPSLKRIKPMARRRFGIVKKRTSHITVVLEEV